MARDTYSSDAERKLIQQLKSDGTGTVLQIYKLLKCSKYKVYNTLEYIKQHGTTKNVKQQSRAWKTTPREDSLIYKIATNNPFTCLSKIKK